MPKISTPPDAPTARDVLAHADAVDRAGRVRFAEYDIALDLVDGSGSYRGDTTVTFTTVGSGPIFLDFRGRRIDELVVNGQPVEPEWTGFRLTLPAEVITDRMSVRLVYENDYDTTGDGFHRFVDPEDDAEYVYTNFEPYEAHRLFPCFDQPDIKGRYRISVTAPSAWVAVANTPAESIDELDDGRRRHRFAESEIFSTYLVAVAAGPYVERSIDHRGLRLGLFARRTLERQLEDHAGEILEITAQGHEFFAELFGQPYPFAKYDQIFVPEYNAGAMENVGAVTYNESYLFRDPPTDTQRLDRGEVLLHELAHMWFGNLVTMRWWDDLWLNESFATYIAYLGLTEATRFRNAWKSFNTGMKRWAYQQDQLVTTHPIAGQAEDTEVAFLNFDGITYGKGAAVLKQLVKAIGRDGFRDGMRLYFRRHAWGNATLSDFLACLEEGSGEPLGEWARLWLETPSLNTIAAEWHHSDGRLADLSLTQTAPPEHPTLRPHALDIALVHDENGRLAIESLPARISAAEVRVENAAGRAVPDFVFPNHGDHAYAKVALDETSVDYMRRHLDRIDDDLLRQLVWMSLWEMVRDCQLRSTDFLAIGREHLDAETDRDIVTSVLERQTLVLGRYVPESRFDAEGHACFESAMTNLHAATDDDGRITWARAAIAAATTRDDVQRLVGLLEGEELVEGFSLDQEMRWAIVTKAIAYGLPAAEQRLAVETARDPSDRGRRALIRAEASRPERRAKEQAWDRIHGAGYGSFHFTRAAMQGFFWPHQWPLLEPFVPRFFDQVRDVFETRDHPYARSYLTVMFPAHRGDPGVLDASRRLLASLDGALPTLARQLAEAADELERAIRIRAYADS